MNKKPFHHFVAIQLDGLRPSQSTTHSICVLYLNFRSSNTRSCPPVHDSGQIKMKKVKLKSTHSCAFPRVFCVIFMMFYIFYSSFLSLAFAAPLCLVCFCVRICQIHEYNSSFECRVERLGSYGNSSLTSHSTEILMILILFQYYDRLV